MQMSGSQDCLRCDYCKSIYFSAQDDLGLRYLDPLPGVLCPACDIPLWNSTYTGISLRACKQCHGLLIGMGAFEDVVDQVRAQHPGTDAPSAQYGDPSRKIDCPVCHRHMESHYYYGGGHVVLASCENCSVDWLDAGSITHIAHAAQ
jgi:Zn-finger nucleic acid-binding protein